MESYVLKRQVREINKRVFANDMLYSDDSEDTLKTLISDIIQQYNPEEIVSGLPTILEIKDNNINKDVLNLVKLLDTKSVYVQFNNRVLGDNDKILVVRQLKESGYKIIIELNEDDEVFTLAKIIADIIKIDIHKIPQKINSKNNKFNCKILAYNVDSADDYALAESTNIDLYEGAYIGDTKTLKVEGQSHSKLNFIEILYMINNENYDIDAISNIIARDSLLAAQVIRLSNSAYFSYRARITSVNDAVVRIGMENLKRWIFLLEFSSNQSESEELLKMSYQRALFCERIIKDSHRRDINSNDAYLIGLFSALDILTGKTLDTEISSMNLSETISDALIYREGIGGELLNLVKAYEDANWNRVDKYMKTFRISKDKAYKIYYKSLEETQNLWKELTKLDGEHKE